MGVSGAGKTTRMDIIACRCPQSTLHTHGCTLPAQTRTQMGASGAGKTTLMDVIACRKTVGRVSGALTANGAPLTPATYKKSFSHLMAYVEQSDVHYPLATVGEALRFAAALRLPAGFPARGRAALVAGVMALVELDELEGALVGKPGAPGV